MGASIQVILNQSFIFVIRLRLGHLMMRSFERNKEKKLLIMEIALITSKYVTIKRFADCLTY
jgi:hypothetical protein